MTTPTDAQVVAALVAGRSDRIQGFHYPPRYVIRDVYLSPEKQEIWSCDMSEPDAEDRFYHQCEIERERVKLTAAFSLAPAGTVEAGATLLAEGIWLLNRGFIGRAHDKFMAAQAALLPPQPSADLPGRDVLETAFKLLREADERAVELWCEAHPDKSLTIPDHTDMVVWLLGLQSDEGIVPNLRWLRQRFDAPADTKERRILDYAIAAIAASAPALVSQPQPEAVNATDLIGAERHKCASLGPCSGNGDGCSCSDAELLRRAGADVAGLVEAHKLDTDKQVFFYEQDFYVLSNFSAFSLRRWGQRFDTSEAAYHWAKFDLELPASREVQNKIYHARSAHDAFKIAEEFRHLRRPDWDQVKVDLMRDILRAKADQHEYVRRKLLATGDRELIEDSWRDDFWGWGPNRDGQNMLGKLWMEVRSELRTALTSMDRRA